MTTFLVIAGHGENKNGSFDPGATGIITKGEHKYYEQDFFPAVKKFLPSNSNVVLFSEHNIYDYKDLVTLAKKYGNDTVVIEMHYDAGSASASGGHVIVHADYAPDKYDLAIRDVVKKHIGVRYTHKGQAGISGRTDLGNCNRAKTGGINYRLVELGFGTNSKDANAMVKNVDTIAKDFVQALIGKVVDVPSGTKTPSATGTHTVVKNDTLWGIAQKYNTDVQTIKSINNLKSDTIHVGDKLSIAKTVATKPVVTTPKPVAKSIDTLVAETLAGKHGNGDARKKSLGSNYDAVMSKINGKTVNKKSVDTIAKEVIAGKFGNGADRKKNVEKAGYNYNEVQKRVNQLL